MKATLIIIIHSITNLWGVAMWAHKQGECNASIVCRYRSITYAFVYSLNLNLNLNFCFGGGRLPKKKHLLYIERDDPRGLECLAHPIECIIPTLETRGLESLMVGSLMKGALFIGKKPLSHIPFTQVHFILDLGSMGFCEDYDP